VHPVAVLTPHHAPFSMMTVAIIALVAWRVYARIRRNIGRQHFVAARSWLSVTLFPLVIVFVAYAVRFQPPLVGLSLFAGVVLGLALGLLGLRLTRFEVSTDGLYYVPSAHLGIALSTLLVARFLYRFVTVGTAGSAPGAAPVAMHLTPLTLALIGTLAGYYVTYAAGLLRWSVRHQSAQPSGMPT
jgi:hypothetical protein